MDNSLTIDTESYTRTAGYQPQIFRDLDPVYQNNLLGNKVPETIRNAIIMHGYMLLSKDFFYSKGFHRHVFQRYSFNNFIFYTKACLDVLAVLITQYCKLPFSRRSDIDFKKEKFRGAVIKAKPHMKSVICSSKDWIEELVLYRDAIIHREYLIFGTRESDQELVVSPEPELGLSFFTKYLSPNRHPYPEQKIPYRKVADIFDSYVPNTQKILELIIDDICSEFKMALSRIHSS